MKLPSHKKDYVQAYIFMFPFFDPNNHINVCNLYSNFQKLLKTEFSSSTIAPGKSGSKNLKLREKYKSTKFPNAFNFIARSQILMFPF